MSGPRFIVQGPTLNPASPTSSRNPTLVPNFGIPVSLGGGGVLSNASPYQYLKENPRGDAQVRVTLGGSATQNDVITVTLSNGILGSEYLGSLSPAALVKAITVGASDTLTTLARNIAIAFNDDSIAQTIGLYVDAAGAVMTFRHNGPVGNFSTIAVTFNGGASESATLLPASGQMAGGSGPIIPLSNFSWCPQGSIYDFYFGKPADVGYATIYDMVASAMPIV